MGFDSGVWAEDKSFGSSSDERAATGFEGLTLGAGRAIFTPPFWFAGVESVGPGV